MHLDHFPNESLRACFNLCSGQTHHPQGRDLVITVLHVREECRFKGRISQFVDSQCAEERVSAHLGNQVGATAQKSRLWTSQQFVTAVRNNVDTFAKAVENTRLSIDPESLQVYKGTAAEVFEKWHVTLARKIHKLFGGRLLRESGDLKIGAVYPQKKTRALTN